jgi:protein Tex
VHVSQLADKFVKDPHEVVKAGDVVLVRVVEVDVARKRIGLTMKRQVDPGAPPPDRKPAPQRGPVPQQKAPPPAGTMAAKLQEAMRKK